MNQDEIAARKWAVETALMAFKEMNVTGVTFTQLCRRLAEFAIDGQLDGADGPIDIHRKD